MNFMDSTTTRRDFVLVKILGVALAAAVVLDATLVRLAVGPALLTLAGRWNWWPGYGATRGENSSREEAKEPSGRTALSFRAERAARRRGISVLGA